MELATGQLDIDGGTHVRTGPGTPCRWCHDPIPAGKRIDAETCSKDCRQARWRLRRRLGVDAPTSRSDTSSRSRRRVVRDVGDNPIRVAYADPPYIGLSRAYYGAEDSYAGEVDHGELIARLEADYPDGWALSCSAYTLDLILPLLPVGEWHLSPWLKPGPPPRRTKGLHYCWEGLIVVRGRQRPPGVRDYLVAHPARRGGTLPGRKPIAFCAFLFQALGLVDEHGRPAHPADELDDLFPGTGIIGRAWRDVSLDATVPSAA